MRPRLVEHRRYFPRLPLWRRGAALAIDLLTALAASLLVGGAAWLVFLPIWWGLRVAVVVANRGQSLGRWAFDLKVTDLRYGKTPDIVTLSKREGVTGVGGLLILIGVQSLSVTNASLLFLVIPLLADCAMAWADPGYQQTLHDRVADTSVIPSRRGYSLDLKLKRLFAQFGSRMK